MPRLSKTAKLFLIAAAVVIVGVGGALAWWLRDDAPAAVSIDTAADAAADGSTENGSSDREGSAEDDPAGEDSGGTTDLDGTWEVVAGSDDNPDDNTFVGYRIEEELAGIGGATAVGRTSEVTGSLTVSGDVVESVEVNADLTTLQSDSSRRDGALRTRGLETTSFPEATFVLTEPVDLPGEAANGEPFTITAVGDFTLHGVTRPVELDLDAQLVGETVVAVGTLPIALSDYDIEAPTGMRVLSIADEGTAEFQLRFAKA